MKHTFLSKFIISTALAVLALSITAFGQTKRTPFDVTKYVIDAQIAPADNKLSATVDVEFSPKEDTRTVSFELNGSLKIDAVTLVSLVTPAEVNPVPTPTPVAGKPKPKPAKTPANTITFLQDQVGISELGPSVKIDLGDNVVKDSVVTLRFKYSGILTLPAGGPLLSKRLAYIGANEGYLMYAARWFPFHDYASDRATSEINVTIPTGYQLVGVSDSPVAPVGGKYKFVRSKPDLIGNLAYGKYTPKTLRYSNYELNFYTRAANDATVAQIGETLGKALDFYGKQFGDSNAGKKLTVVQIDDDSLDYYSGTGIIFLANRVVDQDTHARTERLQREAASQWFGLSVGLKSFDDAWLSQGMSEYWAFRLRENNATTDAQREQLRRELLEKALTFEPTASLARTPANLDDQSTAYQYLMYSKGAFVYDLLRQTLGEQKFNQLVRKFVTEYNGKNVSIDDFEKMTSEIAGQNMRYFFARWVESTGVPEFSSDYLIIRTRAGKFVTRGTVKQNYDNLRLPVEVMLRSEGEDGNKLITLQMDEATADFNIESNGKPLGVVIDPHFKLLRISDDLRITSIARRGIELLKEGKYVEAQAQFEAALKLDRSNSWIYYHLGLLYLEQRNYDLAIDNFKAAVNGRVDPTWLAVWSHIKMGNAYDAKGDRTRATAAYKKALATGDDYNGALDEAKKYQDTAYDPKSK